jgi:glycosyltransferase involved in cell wall biosynthesis
VPLALLEAMLAARPVVATAVGEVPTVLDGGRAGMLAPPRDAAALADALARLLSDPALARRLSAAAALRAAQEYTLAKMTERYAALYAELLTRGPRSTPLVFARA